MIHARQNKISWVSNTVGSSETLAIFKKTCHVYNDRCRSLSLADQTKAQRQRVPPLTGYDGQMHISWKYQYFLLSKCLKFPATISSNIFYTIWVFFFLF